MGRKSFSSRSQRISAFTSFTSPTKPISLPVRELLCHPQEASVLAADADGPDTQSLHELDQLLIDLSKDHLRQLHGGLVGHPQAATNFGVMPALLIQLLISLPRRDDDGLKAHQL